MFLMIKSYFKKFHSYIILLRFIDTFIEKIIFHVNEYFLCVIDTNFRVTDIEKCQ